MCDRDRNGTKGRELALNILTSTQSSKSRVVTAIRRLTVDGAQSLRRSSFGLNRQT